MNTNAQTVQHSH